MHSYRVFLVECAISTHTGPMLDHRDYDLLRLLAKDARLTAAELAEVLALSPSQVSRRRARLEAEGYITGARITLDPAKLGLGVQAFVQVSMTRHSSANAQAFHALIRARAEVTSMWTLTGEADYLLRVYCADLAALNELVHQVLMVEPGVDRVQTRIVMDQIKQDAPLPM